MLMFPLSLSRGEYRFAGSVGSQPGNERQEGGSSFPGSEHIAPNPASTGDSISYSYQNDSQLPVRDFNQQSFTGHTFSINSLLQYHPPGEVLNKIAWKLMNGASPDALKGQLSSILDQEDVPHEGVPDVYSEPFPSTSLEGKEKPRKLKIISQESWKDLIDQYNKEKTKPRTNQRYTSRYGDTKIGFEISSKISAWKSKGIGNRIIIRGESWDNLCEQYHNDTSSTNRWDKPYTSTRT